MTSGSFFIPVEVSVPEMKTVSSLKERTRFFYSLLRRGLYPRTFLDRQHLSGRMVIGPDDVRCRVIERSSAACNAGRRLCHGLLPGCQPFTARRHPQRFRQSLEPLECHPLASLSVQASQYKRKQKPGSLAPSASLPPRLMPDGLLPPAPLLPDPAGPAAPVLPTPKPVLPFTTCPLCPPLVPCPHLAPLGPLRFNRR